MYIFIERVNMTKICMCVSVDDYVCLCKCVLIYARKFYKYMYYRITISHLYTHVCITTRYID